MSADMTAAGGADGLAWTPRFEVLMFTPGGGVVVGWRDWLWGPGGRGSARVSYGAPVTVAASTKRL